MSQTDPLTPLGEIIEAARNRTGLSQNAAATKAETSGTTWRRVIKGIARFAGQNTPFDGAPDTVARMAAAVGVTPEELEDAGRADAAQELRQMSRRSDQMRTTEDHLDDSESILAELRERLERLSPRRRRAVLHVVRELEDDETGTG